MMGEYEIDQAESRLGLILNDERREITRQAIHVMRALIRLTNAVSDGWAYWEAPRRASEKLQTLIYDQVFGAYRTERPTITAKDLRVACRPVKVFLKKHVGALQGKTIMFPWERVAKKEEPKKPEDAMRRLVQSWRAAAQDLADLTKKITELNPNYNVYLAMDSLHLMRGPSHSKQGEPLQGNSVATVLIPSASGGDW